MKRGTQTPQTQVSINTKMCQKETKYGYFITIWSYIFKIKTNFTAIDLILQFDFLKVKIPLLLLSSFKIAPVKMLHYEINQLIKKKQESNKANK